MRIALPSELSGRPGILGAASTRLGTVASMTAETCLMPEASSAARENLSHRAYLRIRASLIHSELRPGQRLVLRPLAAELQLSPTPVREALLRLVSEQALALDSRGSAIVPVIGLAELHEIIDIRCDLEGRAAMRAAQHASAVDIELVGSVIAAWREAAENGDLVAILGCNAELHRMVCRMARASLMLRILEGLWMRIGPVYALTPPDMVSALSLNTISQHEHLLEALRARDADAARDAVIADVRSHAAWLADCLDETQALQAA